MSEPNEVEASWLEERGILRFVDDNFAVELDPWQEKALLAYEDPRPDMKRIALQACVGPGKTAVLAWCGWWFLSTQGDELEHPKGLATSITGDNLKDNLWSEFAKWQGHSEYLRETFEWTSRRIAARDHPETWFLGVRSWPKTASADEQGKTFSGLHAKYVTALVDESGAIPPPVGRAAEQALARAVFAKFLQAGNPISREGMLFEATNRLAHLWHVIKITGDPEDPEAWVHSPRVGPEPLEWAIQQIETYGRENPWVKSYILGLFPPGSFNALLTEEDVEAAFKRVIRPDAYEWSQPRLGVDVARFGDDRSVIFYRQGNWTRKPVVMRNEPTTNIAAAVMTCENSTGSELTLVDDTGHWGHGVIDNLIAAGRNALPVVFSDKAIKPQYYNRRAEMWFEMADAIKKGLRLPNMRELIGELTTPTYTMDRGKIRLEEKDQIKKRLGKSPDLADALALTFALPEMPKSSVLPGGSRPTPGHADTDFDPYAAARTESRRRHRDDDARPGRAATDFDPYE